MLRFLISFIRAESAAYTTEYSLHKLLGLARCGVRPRGVYAISCSLPLCVFCVSQQFPMSQTNADIKFREQCLSESQKKKNTEQENTKIETQHTHTQATATSNWREGQKKQQGKMAMLPFGLPDPCYNLSCTQEERRIEGRLVGANNDAIAGVDIVIMWCCSLMCVVPLSCAC